MSEVLDTPTSDDQRPERAVTVAKRVFAADLVPGQGRTVDVRIVPYGQRAKSNDGLAGLPRGVIYEEEIAPGAFDHQLNAANRVHMNVEHEEGINGKVGCGISLATRSDGLYGSFKFFETQAGETALALTREGALGGVSFEAQFKKSVRTAAGVVRRVKVNLVNIALCRDPAYENALILGLRSEEPEMDLILDEALLPIPFNPEIAARAARALGKPIPQRQEEAHPADNGHPGEESGTPEDGTRPTENTPTSED